MITTRRFALSKNDYFKILLSLRIRNTWWLYLLIVLMPLYFLKDFGTNTMVTFIVIYCLAFIPVMMLYLFYWSRSKENAIVYVPKSYEINNEHLTVITDEKRGDIEWKYIIKVVELKDFWILYISKGQFIPISKAAFYDRDERVQFGKILQKQNLVK